MLSLAALLMAMPGQTAAPCPAPVMAFAPPLSTPMILRRRIERALTDGVFVYEATYRLTFVRAGSGYRMHWQQIDERSEGPGELLRLLELQERSASGESFDVTLDKGGAVLGISESPGSAERLAQAIDRLRNDPAVTARPAQQRAQLAAMLDRLATLPTEERIALHRARLERPVMLAGRPCSSGQVIAADGTAYRIAGESGDSLHLVAARALARETGGSLSVSDDLTLSRANGMVQQFDRRTVTTVAGTSRNSRESVSLERAPNDP